MRKGGSAPFSPDLHLLVEGLDVVEDHVHLGRIVTVPASPHGRTEPKLGLLLWHQKQTEPNKEHRQTTETEFSQLYHTHRQANLRQHIVILKVRHIKCFRR